MLGDIPADDGARPRPTNKQPQPTRGQRSHRQPVRRLRKPLSFVSSCPPPSCRRLEKLFSPSRLVPQTRATRITLVQQRSPPSHPHPRFGPHSSSTSHPSAWRQPALAQGVLATEPLGGGATRLGAAKQPRAWLATTSFTSRGVTSPGKMARLSVSNRISAWGRGAGSRVAGGLPRRVQAARGGQADAGRERGAGSAPSRR